MKVFVTGSSSHLASSLLTRLCARPDIERVTGIDLAPPRFAHARFTAAQLDIRSPQVEALLPGHHALIHLASFAPPDRAPEREGFEIHVTGSHKLFHAARRAGASRFILMSSAAVYGSGVHLNESAPLAPRPQSREAGQLAHLEQLLAIEFPDCVRFRPHLVLGPNAPRQLKQLLGLPCYVRAPGSHPLLQCVHEDDVARAVLLALDGTARGPFNLATEDNFTLRDVVKRRHRFAVPLPHFAARAGLRVARHAFGWIGEMAWIEGLTRTLLINCRRAAVELRWRSAYDAAAVLAQTQ